MSEINYRLEKGRALSSGEIDDNFRVVEANEEAVEALVPAVADLVADNVTNKDQIETNKQDILALSGGGVDVIYDTLALMKAAYDAQPDGKPAMISFSDTTNPGEVWSYQSDGVTYPDNVKFEYKQLAGTTDLDDTTGEVAVMEIVTDNTGKKSEMTTTNKTSIIAGVNENKSNIDVLKKYTDRNIIDNIGNYYSFSGLDVGDVFDGLTLDSGGVVDSGASDCVEGDEFYLKLKGGYNARAWCFVNSNNEIISYADTGINLFDTPITLTTPSGGVKAYFNHTTTDEPIGYSTKVSELSKSKYNDAVKRENHTGTQLADTISDFVASVKANETVTSLSISSNILSFIDEDGDTTTIDLSLYLDDTNLSRLTSGVLDPITNIATFTRDDDSTFTLDLSNLNDRSYVDSKVEELNISILANNQKTEDLKESLSSKKINITQSPVINPSIDLNGTITEISSLGATYQEDEKSFNFTGTEYISVNQNLDFTNGGTVLAELKVDDWEANGRFFANSVGFNPPIGGFALQLSSTYQGLNKRELVLKSTDNVNIISEDITDIYDSVWIKVAFMITDTGLVKMYLNGNELNIIGTDTVAIPTSTNPIILGNLNNDGSYDRPMLGNLKKVTVLERVATSVEVANWNNGVDFEEAETVFKVDFSKKIGDGDNAVYFNDESGDFHTRNRLNGDGELIKEVYNNIDLIWEEVNELTQIEQDIETAQTTAETAQTTAENISASVGVSQSTKIIHPIGYATDGWGGGVTKAHLQPIETGDFEYINTGVDLSTSVGEAFHGLCVAGDWLVQAPQDHDSAVFYNTITKEVVEVDLSAYVRAIPSVGNNFRDKFNGITSTHGGKYVWIAPSWTTHCVKIDVETMSIVDDFEVNTTRDDAYNGIVATRKYIWLVTHSKEDLPRINIETGFVDIFPITEDVAGDYNMNEASVANNRSFLGGSDNGNGTIWLHPRRSKYMVLINEETGGVIKKTKHPLADLSNPVWGYFHGGTNVNGKVWFSAWGYEKIVWYDIVLDSWGSQDVSLTGDSQWGFGTVTDGRFIYCPPFRAREVVKIDTLDNSIHIIDCGDAVTAFQNGATRVTSTEGFAGGSVVKDGCVWFSSSLESSFIKLPIKELGSQDTTTNGSLKSTNSVMSANGEFYFNSDLRLKRVGDNIEIQQDSGSGFVTVKTL